MTSSPSKTPLSWQESRYRWAAIPGWCLSLILHALFLLLLSTQLKSCGGVMTGDGEGVYRTVGLVMKDSETPNFNDQHHQNDSPHDRDNHVTEKTEVLEVPEKPPLEMTLPDAGTELIGPGLVAPAIGSPLSNPLRIQSSHSSIPLAPPFGQGDGPVRFIGAVDNGSKFVYIVDCSGSMGDYNALEFAKAELLASLQGITTGQKFQIIFYNEEVQRLQLQKSVGGMYVATDVNRNLAKRFIARVQPELGTRHLPALQAALGYEPDVIFFLTDAREPSLSKRELEQLKAKNRSQAHIHCIEFGRGNELKGDSFLKQLARQNSGTHSYRDVTRLYKKGR